MNRNMVETVMGAVVLLTAALFVMFVYEKRTVNAGEGYDVQASFDNVSGIAAGSDVRIGGIKVGTVTSLALNEETYRPLLSLRLKPTIKLPEDSSAAIVSESLLGGKFIQLSPGADDKMLEEGGEIRFTQSAVNLEEMIGKFMFSGGGVEDEDKKPEADASPTAGAASSFLE